MGTDGSEARSVVGDPTKMSDKSRDDGIASVVSSLADHVAVLTHASGTVTDHRRLVAFVYLLLRDNMPCGVMAEIMNSRMAIKNVRLVHLYSKGYSVETMEERASKLTSGPVAPVRDWLAIVYLQTQDVMRVTALIERIPDDDDTVTVFTNGWLARYAQYVADELLALTEDDACQA